MRHGVRHAAAGHALRPNIRKIPSLADNAAAAIQGLAEHGGVAGFSGAAPAAVLPVYEAAGE